MPEYLTPGVYVEETSFPSKTIAGVSTSTTAFVGPTPRCPAEGASEPLTSFAEFERAYGAEGTLHIAGIEAPNYMAHAARAFFAEGGRRLYVIPVTVPHHGRPLTVEDYLGEDRPTKSGFAALDEWDDASLVAAPGATAEETLGRGVMQALVRHVEQHRYRFAVLDPIRGQSIEAARRLRRGSTRRGRHFTIPGSGRRSADRTLAESPASLAAIGIRLRYLCPGGCDAGCPEGTS